MFLLKSLNIAHYCYTMSYIIGKHKMYISSGSHCKTTRSIEFPYTTFYDGQKSICTNYTRIHFLMWKNEALGLDNEPLFICSQQSLPLIVFFQWDLLDYTSTNKMCAVTPVWVILFVECDTKFLTFKFVFSYHVYRCSMSSDIHSHASRILGNSSMQCVRSSASCTVSVKVKIHLA
jgi:hypothetical protein